MAAVPEPIPKRSDNITVDDIDINVKVEQLDDSDSDEPQTKPKPVQDPYNHRKYSKTVQLKDEIDPFAGTDEIDELRRSRRALSERLESDPEFREKYMREESAMCKGTVGSSVLRYYPDDPYREATDPLDGVEADDTKSSIDDAIRKINKRQGILSEELPDPAPGIGAQKPGIYIHTVTNMTVNIHI